jgi:transcriptional regulator with XRE-family HTH domain
LDCFGFGHTKSQAGLARATGARPASISDWVNDRTKSINSKYLTSAANYFGVSSDWLATGKGPKQTQDGHAVDSLAPQSSTGPAGVAQGVEAISAALAQMTDAQREVMAGKLASLARAPDSATLKKSISESLGSAPLPPDPE